MELFGYGERTGIDLPGEAVAQVPTDQWKRQLFAEPWTTGDDYNAAIGQGYVLATPLQVLGETAAVANGGTIVVPQVVHHMTDANGGVQKDFATGRSRGSSPSVPKRWNSCVRGCGQP